MRRACISIIIFLLVAVELNARTVELILYPAQIPESEQKYQLLPKADQQIDADAVPLYEKAIESMPKGIDQKQIQEWLKLSIERFPQKEAEEMIQKCLESLRLVSRAVRCKECNWPEWRPGTQPVNLNKYRDLAFVIRLWARLEISRGQFNGAVVAMQTGFGMARHLGEAPTINQGLVGISVSALMCKEIEQFVQQKDSPNLYWALENLPRPFVNIEKAITNEGGNITHNRVHEVANGFSNYLDMLQAVEAIRHYAAIHEGQLPETLSDISEVEVPKDLISGEAFDYRQSDSGAILKSAIPEGIDEKDASQYKIILGK